MPHVQRVNPRDDIGFVARVDELSATVERAEDLERGLRETHPHAVVRSRGLSGDLVEVWYVYRDGSWTESGGSPDP